MMASTDFSTKTSQKTKPSKPTLRDAKPQQAKVPSNQPLPTFETSQKAHAWTDTQNFSGLFSQDQGVPQGSVVGPSPGVGGAGGDDGADKQGGKFDGGNLPAW